MTRHLIVTASIASHSTCNSIMHTAMIHYRTHTRNVAHRIRIIVRTNIRLLFAVRYRWDMVVALPVV